jgi:bifunctional ADP-heptose synthase (sugar kinase/adenylyltransferase)
MKILVIGDSCTDVFVYGNVQRLCPEAPVPVFVPLHQKDNHGMAGNVAANLRALGAEVNLITNKNTIVKTRYVDESYNHMMLRVDKGDFCSRINDIPNDLLKYDAVVISDYCKGFLEEEDIVKISKRSNCPVFLDTKRKLGTWCDDIDFIKINNFEYDNNKESFERLPSLIEKTIITKGKYGCSFNNKCYSTQEVLVKDVSGAGDTFISGLAYKYAISRDIEESINFAQECTTIVVQKKGVATI